MKQAAFEARYRASWLAFEKCLEGTLLPSSGRSVLRKRSKSVPAADVPLEHDASADFSFGERYRLICNHYALAQQRGYSLSLLDYLNDLSVRGHGVLYQNKTHFRYQLIQFLMFGFPQAVRREWKLVAGASVFFYLPLIGMVVAISIAPELAYSVYSPEQISNIEAMYDPSAEHIGRAREAETDLAMFGFYISNNIGIGFQTVVTGIIGGLGSLFYLIYNGMGIGTAAGHLIELGYHRPFIGFVSGHSAFELTGIVIAGAAGLKIGFSLLFPGRLRRLNALTLAVAESVTLIYGVVLMLLVAAFIEAFWSSNGNIAFVVKIWVGIGAWCLVLAYFLFQGRQGEA